eukprot:TRINITY_DN4853_c0_g1_i1.p1 TRINITY_DN4853_c0_g1~~TRINITY_DN4853_c0_g1_i1.p1  ORF type:complete len:196 (-),score=47.42 TRINITY_DN4853_c0_g1_i1:61-585(-)
MKHLLLLLSVFCGSIYAQISPCADYAAEKLNEGYFPCVYKDPVGIPTVGVGFNLKRPDAPAELQRVGATYSKVLAGTQCLTDAQIRSLAIKDLQTAAACGARVVSNWSTLPAGPKSALVDMIFNLGCAGFSQFKKTIASVEKKDWVGASRNMADSKWCGQVGNRCGRDRKCMTG